MLDQVREVIRQITPKEDYTKEDLLINQLLLKEEGKLHVYWAPFDYINQKAKVMLLGITPGWTQMHNAFKYVIAHNDEPDVIALQKEAKKEASFSGPMRKFLLEMLDEIGLNKYLNIDRCEQLFTDRNDLVHMTSILRYPVFIDEKNYTGSSPKMLKNKPLMDMINDYFIPELNQLEEDVIIIPMGKAVCEVLDYLVKNQKITHKHILYHFPHPSGANGHRKRQFMEHKEMFKEMLLNIKK